jgi:hypothetical protein
MLENVLEILFKGREVDAWVPNDENCTETEEERLQRKAEIEQVFEDVRRQEQIMSRQP